MNHPNRSHRLRPARRYRCGATLVLVVVLLPVLIAMAAYLINLTHLQTLNTDVQIAADAAVKAAGREYAVSGGDQNKALIAAQTVAALNPIGTHVLPLSAEDLEFGVSNRTSLDDVYSFSPAANGNAVRLTTRSLALGKSTSIKPVFSLPGNLIRLRSTRQAVSTQATMDIALVIDRSGSMAYASDEVSAYPPSPAAATPGWSFGDAVPPHARWLDLIAAVQTFNQEMNESPLSEQVSLSLYNHGTHTPVKLTTDYSQFITALGAVSLSFAAGGTNIGGGMLEGAAAVTDPSISRPFATKVVVLLTDGIHNYGIDPDHAANQLANQAITVFTITFSDEADQTRMESVAAKCGGRHHHATDVVQLKAAFREIARSLPTLLTK